MRHCHKGDYIGDYTVVGAGQVDFSVNSKPLTLWSNWWSSFLIPGYSIPGHTHTHFHHALHHLFLWPENKRDRRNHIWAPAAAEQLLWRQSLNHNTVPRWHWKKQILRLQPDEYASAVCFSGHITEESERKGMAFRHGGALDLGIEWQTLTDVWKRSHVQNQEWNTQIQKSTCSWGCFSPQAGLMNGRISFSISGCLPSSAAVIEGILWCTQSPVKGRWQDLGFYAELRCGLSFLLSPGLASLLDQHKAFIDTKTLLRKPQSAWWNLYMLCG